MIYNADNIDDNVTNKLTVSENVFVRCGNSVLRAATAAHSSHSGGRKGKEF